MKAEDYVCEWCDKTYGGGGEIDDWSTREVMMFANDLSEKNNLSDRSAKIELLESYSKFLQKEGYLDTDWNTEPPYAIDEFLKTIK
jgi:hypothetical protein